MNLQALQRLGYYQASMTECAAALSMTDEAFTIWMDSGARDTYEQGRQQGLLALRQKQWDKAVKDGDAATLAMLGKLYLNQKDNNVNVVVNLKEILQELANEKRLLIENTPPGGKLDGGT